MLYSLIILAINVSCSRNETELSLPDRLDPSVTTASDEVSTTTATTATITILEPSAGFTPSTVWFDPANPPEQAELEDLIAQTMRADLSNLRWCQANAPVCDVERDLGATITAGRVGSLNALMAGYREDGAITRDADEDDVFLVDIPLANLDDEFALDGERLIGAAVGCLLDTGVYHVPASDDQEELVLNDDRSALIAEYRIWQDEAGYLKVATLSNVESGGVELCDLYR